MPLTVLANIPGLVAQNQLTITQQNLQKTLFQLSSGSRINSGADDAAGLAIANDTSNGLTRRPLMMSQAASVVRASATPWPSTAASINMLARFRTGPCAIGSLTPAASNHLFQFFQSSRRNSGNLNKSDGVVMPLGPAMSLGLHTGKSRSEHSRTTSSPAQSPSP